MRASRQRAEPGDEQSARGHGLHQSAPGTNDVLLHALLQGEFLNDVVPLVVAIVARDPLASPGHFSGDLLRGLMRVPGDFWSRDHQLYDCYRAALRASALARRRLPHRQRMEFWSVLEYVPLTPGAHLTPPAGPASGGTDGAPRVDHKEN